MCIRDSDSSEDLADSEALIAEVVGESDLSPWEEEEEFRVARTVGINIAEDSVSFASFFAILGISIWLFGFVIDVFTVDWTFGKHVREGFPALAGKTFLGLDILPWSGTNRVSLALILLSVFSCLLYTSPSPRD